MRTSLRIRQGERGGGCWQCVEGGRWCLGTPGESQDTVPQSGPPVLRGVNHPDLPRDPECEQLNPFISGSWSRIYMGWLAWGILNFLLADKSLFWLSLIHSVHFSSGRIREDEERSLDA